MEYKRCALPFDTLLYVSVKLVRKSDSPRLEPKLTGCVSHQFPAGANMVLRPGPLFYELLTEVGGCKLSPRALFCLWSFECGDEMARVEFRSARRGPRNLWRFRKEGYSGCFIR